MGGVAVAAIGAAGRDDADRRRSPSSAPVPATMRLVMKCEMVTWY